MKRTNEEIEKFLLEIIREVDYEGWYLDESYDKSSYWNMKKKSCIICLGKGYLNIES